MITDKDTTIITGANGFLGKNLVEQIEKAIPGRKVLVCRMEKNLEPISYLPYEFGDLTSQSFVEHLFAKWPHANRIIHLAASSSSRNSNSSIVDNNIKATLNLLEFCKPGTEFIFASSISIYGSGNTAFHETSECKPNSVYAISKWSCEQFINLYYKKGKIKPRILRFCYIIGKGLSHGRIHEILNGTDKITLYGKPPGSRIPFITTKNAVQAIINASIVEKDYIVCNISPDDNLSLEKAFTISGEQLGKKITIEWLDKDDSLTDCTWVYNNRADYELDLRITETSKEALISGIKQIQRV